MFHERLRFNSLADQPSLYRDRAEINELISQLEAKNPTPNPAEVSLYVPLLGGGPPFLTSDCLLLIRFWKP